MERALKREVITGEDGGVRMGTTRTLFIEADGKEASRGTLDEGGIVDIAGKIKCQDRG